MDAKTLYIIGNGFDKQHGIPSDYLDFKAFVELHDDDVFGWVEEFVPAGEDWAHLETALTWIRVPLSRASSILGPRITLRLK